MATRRSATKQTSRAAGPGTAKATTEVKKKSSTSLGDYVRRQRQLANISLRKMAEQSGLSAGLLSEIESGIHNPSQTILQSLARGLRLSAETLYLQAGVLDPRDVEESDSVREILRDPHLTERQRDALVEVYRSFRSVNEA